jgi:hypothetical protein
MPSKPHVVILGPSKDHAGQGWPLELRSRVLKALSRMKCPAVVMEHVPDLEGENAARKFDRIIRDWNVRAFLVIWPKGCRLNGLDIELGWILKELVSEHLDPRDVQLVTQVDHIKIKDEGDEGTWAMSETGNRTRYYAALVDEGCTIRRYASLADMNRNVNAAGLEHIQRHLAGLTEREFVGKAAAELSQQSRKSNGKKPQK